MAQALRSTSVALVLRRDAPADLAARWWPGMEAFVAVKPGQTVYRDDEETPIPNTYEGDGFRYYGFRLQAAGDEKKPINYPLPDLYHEIGYSGWDYLEGVARSVGFDFDDILGHKKVGLTDDALAVVMAALKKLPYVEIRRSTSGGGYHVWVSFPIDDLPKIADRLEMKALARAVLARMSLDTGFHFEGGVDHLGDILWVCSRRATAENRGLTLIQPAERPMKEWPKDFREHLAVVTRRRQKTLLKGTSAKESDAIERAHKDRSRAALESAHRKFMEEYETTGCAGYWCEDHGCFVGHTVGIAKVVTALKLPGVFGTVSEGRNPLEPNCWLYPLKGGGWRVFRFNKGTPESATWETSQSGWTTCVVGLRPTARQVATRYGGMRNGKGYVFTDPAKAQLVVAAYNRKLQLPAWLEKHPRPITIEIQKDGLVVSMTHKKSDAKQTAYNSGWFEANGPLWRTFLECDTSSQQTDYEGLADDVVRHVARAGDQLGLYAHTTQGWQRQTTKQIENHLSYKGVRGGAQVDLLGWCSDHPWLRVALPFQNEQPGDRLWNLDGCKLQYQPADYAGPTPYWDRLFQHWGRGLNEAVWGDGWCAGHNIKDGADYLQVWLATALGFPERRLPMLATYSGENNTGKSFMHESWSDLFTQNGYMLAEKAIKNKNGFDAELHGRVLCGLDDIDLSADNGFYDSLKRWITNPWMNYGYKGKEVFLDRNYTHWVYTTQKRTHIPVDTGDERIVLWEMAPFPASEMIPKDDLRKFLDKESPFLLTKLFALDLSEVHSRLALPPLLTAEKMEVMAGCEPLTLSGVALKLAEAIKKMPNKPWGPGTATELDAALGNWHENTQAKNRANSLGRYMPRVAKHLGNIDIGSDGKVSRYTIKA